jgi:hypothetical protein
MAQVAKAFAAWEKVLGVTFVRDDANAQIRFGVGDLSDKKSDDGVTNAAGYNVRQFTGNVAADYNVVVMSKSSDTNMDGVEWTPGDGGFYHASARDRSRTGAGASGQLQIRHLRWRRRQRNRHHHVLPVESALYRRPEWVRIGAAIDAGGDEYVDACPLRHCSAANTK